MTWFHRLTGLSEETAAAVYENLSVEGEILSSRINGKSWTCGTLETPTLGELRDRAETGDFTGKIVLGEVVGDVQQLHKNGANAGAMFQVASQFNLLEMVSPSVTPEEGVGNYEHDRTQGPACAIAAGAGTIYRNYFAEVNDSVGQTHDNQIDCLADMGALLRNMSGRLWAMQNGYALATESGLKEIAEHLKNCSEAEKVRLRESLRIGIQWNTEVTLEGASHLLSQVYCSALPVAYSRHSSALWADFARLILEAAYEATFSAAIVNSAKTGNPRLYLTLLGGGAFGNDIDWICAAIRRSMRLYQNANLEVSIVSYGSSKACVRELIAELDCKRSVN